MPLVLPGVYIYDDDKPYEYESAYYLGFQIRSALSSLAHLNEYNDFYNWKNQCEYYHYYTDHLLYSMGQIANRFVSKREDKEELRERKRKNSVNYQFSKDNFPILSDNRARNLIEHIDEYNQKIIKEHNGVGGFNLIYDEAPRELIELLRDKRDTHIYTLDLIKKEILLRKKKVKLTISLNKLKEELLSLQNNVDYLLSFL